MRDIRAAWDAILARASTMMYHGPVPMVARTSPDGLSRFGASPAPGLGKLWTGSIFPGLNAASDDRIVALLPKKSEGEMPLTLGVNDTSDFGPQCPLVKNDDTTLLARLGGGYCQEYPDLSDGKGVPEVLLGCQLEERLNRRSKVFGVLECASDPADLGHHRVRAKAAWEVLLDADSRLSLRTSVLADSDYAPNGEQAKNLKCAVDLGWKF